MLAGRDRASQSVGTGSAQPVRSSAPVAARFSTQPGAAADLGLPVVNCPTVASSDAPCSALSVIYTEEGVFQEYRFYRKNPDLVLVDTQVIAEAPPRLLVAGMGDALATWFEARTCVAGSVRNMRAAARPQVHWPGRALLSDPSSRRSPALHAVSTQVVTPSLERLVEANTLLSGLGFESSGLAAAHAVHNGLTAVHETHAFFHGEKVAFGLLVQLVLEGASGATVEEVLRFFRRGGSADHPRRHWPDRHLPATGSTRSLVVRLRPAKPSTTSRSRSRPIWSRRHHGRRRTGTGVEEDQRLSISEIDRDDPMTLDGSLDRGL